MKRTHVTGRRWGQCAGASDRTSSSTSPFAEPTVTLARPQTRSAATRATGRTRSATRAKGPRRRRARYPSSVPNPASRVTAPAIAQATPPGVPPTPRLQQAEQRNQRRAVEQSLGNDGAEHLGGPGRGPPCETI